MNRKGFCTKLLPLQHDMYRLAVALLRDADAAADAVQDTFASLWTLRSALDDIDNLRAYSMRTLRNRCLDILRHRSASPLTPHADVADTAEAIPSPSPDPHRLLDADDSLRLIKRLIDALPHQQRLVMRLSAFNGLSNPEIAAVTGISEPNVRVLLCRARKHLRDNADIP